MKILSLLPSLVFTSFFLLLLLVSCLSSPAIRYDQELQGRLREGGNAPFSSLLLVTPGQKQWEITGPLQEELRSFLGMEVKVVGQESERGPLYPRFVAEHYEILSAGEEGERPLIGYVEKQQGEVLLRSSDSLTPLRLTGPLLPQLKTLVGEKIWVVGEKEQDHLQVKRFGVIH